MPGAGTSCSISVVLTFLDAAGLRGGPATWRAGVEVVLPEPSRPVRRVLDLTEQCDIVDRRVVDGQHRADRTTARPPRTRLRPVRRRLAGADAGAATRRSVDGGAPCPLRGVGWPAASTQLSAHFMSGTPVSMMEHDVAVYAINERLLELNDPERLPYEYGDAPR